MSNIPSQEEFNKWCSGVKPSAFEQIVGEIFQNNGLETQVTPLVGDGGIDVILYRKKGDSSRFSGEVDALVQVKRNTNYNTVDPDPLEKLVEVAPEYDPSRLIIVSTGKFGGPVRNKATEITEYNIELLHSDDLYEMASEDIISKIMSQYESRPGRKNWW